MANTTVRDDIAAPCFAVVHTSFAAQIVLHEDSTNGGAAPAGIAHLPAALFVVAEAGDILAFKDASDTTRTITFTGVTFAGTIRVAAKTLETATTCVSVTALYNPEP